MVSIRVSEVEPCPIESVSIDDTAAMADLEFDSFDDSGFLRLCLIRRVKMIWL